MHDDYDGKVIFPYVDAPLHTEEAFNAIVDQYHHVAPCPSVLLTSGFCYTNWLRLYASCMLGCYLPSALVLERPSATLTCKIRSTKN